jgi:cytochrome c-type biogenesis protein CcmH/NrfF
MESVAVRATRRTLALALVARSIGIFSGGVVSSAEEAPSPSPSPSPSSSWAYELWHDLMSPYCPGRTLAECPSPAADELRLWILTQAAAGAERAEVEASLYARFGDEIRTTPKAEGWGLAAYVIPAVAFLVFGGIVWLVLRRLVGGGEASTPVLPSVSESASALAPIPVSAVQYSEAELESMVDEELGT